MNIFDEVVHKVNNPVIAWKVLANYFISYLLNYGPKYQEYLRTPEAKEMDNNFFGDDNNDALNHILGFEKQLTPKQRFHKLIEFYSYCFEKNQQEASLLDPGERQYVSAMTPEEAAAFRKNRDVREPDMSDIDEKIKEGKFRPSYAERIKKMRRQKAERFHHSVEDSADFVVAEVIGASTFSTDQCGQLITDGETYYGFVDEDEMSDFISEESKQKLLNKMYELYESRAAFLFDAKEYQPELMADHMFAEDDMLLLSEFAIVKGDKYD